MPSPQERVRSPGQPVDRLLAVYALVAALPLAFPHRPDTWPLLAAAHLAAMLIGFGARPAVRLWNRWATSAPRVAPLLHDLYPLVLVPFLYAELEPLNRAVWNGRYFDALIQNWEQSIFGLQPSREWAAAAPILPLSEVLHAAYLSYYFIIFAPPFLILWRAGRAALHDALFALIFTFLVHYLFFIWFPVQGPRYLFDAPSGPVANGTVFRLVHRVLEAGSSQGAAFPSSHVGVAVAQTLLVWRHLPRLTPVVALLALGLALGAVYGGFHYATDVIAGALLGVLCVVAAPYVARALGSDRRTATP
jgi:membrane-associated phospholipid phosphatase